MLFVTLLGVTFLIALAVSFIVVQMFRRPIDSILERIISDEISKAWSKYLRFAMYVTGISSGVNLYKIEQYITAPRYPENAKVVELTKSRWVLEVYRTIIETLQGIAWMLLVFFVFALIAFVIVRVFELKRKAKEQAAQS
jgi:ABC-type xylose transport system permease subunit